MALTDNFNRANESPLASPWGQWASLGRLNLVSNVCSRASGTAGYAIYTGTTWNANQTSLCTLTQRSGNLNCGYGAIGRASGGAGAHTGYFFYNQQDFGPVHNLYLFKFVSGTATQLGTTGYGGTPTVGDTIKIECTGTTITGYVNGVSKISVTDAAVAGPGSPGIYAATELTDTIDDWTGTGETVTVPEIPFLIIPSLMEYYRTYDLATYGNVV